MGSLLLSSTLLALLKVNAKSVAGIGLCIILYVLCVHLVVVSIVWSVYLHVPLE